jgi:hypothetical protein
MKHWSCSENEVIVLDEGHVKLTCFKKITLAARSSESIWTCADVFRSIYLASSHVCTRVRNTWILPFKK